MIDLQGIDYRISQITREVDFYSYLTPLNQKEERERFLESLKQGKVYNPVFKYKDVEFFYQEKWLRDTRNALDGNDLAQRLFIEKMDFISKQLELIASDDVKRTKIAVELFGSPDEECLKVAEDILTESKDQEYEFPEETVTPDEMASMLTGRLEDKGIDWKVVLSRKIVPKITVSAKDRTIYINSDINYTAEEVERLKIHEIEVHVYRGANGSEQPFKIFRDGLAGYDETEEGLAILAEEKAGCLKVDTRQMKLYAGRTVAAYHCLRKSFYETFVVLREFFPEYLAYRLTERAKRGLRDASGAGGFPRDFHYISGRKKVRQYIDSGGDLSILYTGKIGINDASAVKDLVKKGVLKPPRYLPKFIKGK